MQRRGGTLVGLVVGTSLLVACSDAGGEAEGPSSSPSSSSSSVSSGPGGGESSSAPVVPVVPEAARGDDDAAAVAFVEHWVELVNYAIATGDTEPLEAVTGPDCAVCDGMYAELAAEGGAGSASGTWSVTESVVRPPSAGDLGPAVTIVEADIRIGAAPDTSGALGLGLDRTDDGWSVSWATVDQA